MIMKKIQSDDSMMALEPLQLGEAHGRIFSKTVPTEKTIAELRFGMERVCGQTLECKMVLPFYDQSARDGFVVMHNEKIEKTDPVIYQVIGEIPAGSPGNMTLSGHVACRIMTGGMIPQGATRVVPQEDCVVDNDMVTIPQHALRRKNTFIERAGSQIAAGELVTDAGTILLPEHLALLAAAGYNEIEVFRRPRVGFFCTGSELVGTPDQLAPGLKISTNRYLLAGLIRQFLAEGEDLGVAKDSSEELRRVFEKARQAASLDILISTGGMGPGKYDLLEEAFCRAGGQVVFRSLDMRPGRSTLFGRLGDALFFGLPGPPGAVRTLMNELVGPTILRLQGVNTCEPVALRAKLAQPVRLKNDDVLHIKAGILSFAGGYASVRLAGRLEIATCFILFPVGKNVYNSQAEVEVHLAYSPLSSRIFNLI
jgi:molybdopterin molybdotransferase